MPLQNRVTPLSEPIAVEARGLLYGNRGCLHDDEGRIVRRWATRRWIACVLEFRGWKRGPFLQPGKFTELFFLDEATAFAAGHRPCALCRNAEYRRFVGLWKAIHPGQDGADAIDLQLHGERVAPRTSGRRLHDAVLGELPSGTMVLVEDEPWLVAPDSLARWTPAGYAERRARDERARVRLITPPSLAAVLAAGWTPLLHPTATAPS
jgi:hypothetical protein